MRSSVGRGNFLGTSPGLVWRSINVYYCHGMKNQIFTHSGVTIEESFMNTIMIGMAYIVGILSNDIVDFIIPDYRAINTTQYQFHLSLNTPVSRKTKRSFIALLGKKDLILHMFQVHHPRQSVLLVEAPIFIRQDAEKHRARSHVHSW